MKWRRHILFWVVYCSFFYLQSISPRTLSEITAAVTYRNAFFSLCCFIPACVLCVYTSINFIFPRYIQKGRYGAALLGFVFLFTVVTCFNYFAASAYYQLSGVQSKGPLLLGYLNTIWAMIITGLAVGVKAVRKWDRERKEIAEITRNKTRNELSLQKHRMHPEFLYSNLDRIHHSLTQNNDCSSAMILTLSNVLSYSLYESENEYITLQDEICAVEDFIFLEKQSNRQVSLTVDEKINADEIVVPPMIVFSALQDNFLKMKEADVTNCVTDIIIKRSGDHIAINMRFSGDCADSKITSPVNIRIPLIAADHQKASEYVTA